MPSREAPSSAGRSPECLLGCRQGMTQEGRKQMRFGNGQSGQTSQHHLVAVGDSGDTDNSERSREYRIAGVHNRWVYGVILGGLLNNIYFPD